MGVETGPVWDTPWQEWLTFNLQRGCDRAELFRIIVRGGFSEEVAEAQLVNVSAALELPSSAVSSRLHRDAPPLEHVFPSLHPNPEKYGGHSLFIPLGERIESSQLEIFRLRDFLNEEECERLIDLGLPILKPSSIVTYTPDVEPLFRTSLTAEMSSLDDEFVHEIDHRICQMLGISTHYSEEIQIQLYRVGAEFKPHHDYFAPGTREYDEHAGLRGQRTWTVMIYLNNTPAGGQTSFPEVDIMAYPELGTAVIWNNLYDDGRPNPFSKHHGMPVIEGTKAVITKWFRSRGAGHAFVRTRNEYLRPLTREGFRVMRIPPGVWKLLQQEMESGHESSSTGGTEGETTLPEALRSRLQAELRGVLEIWCGVALEPTDITGIQRLSQGTTLPFVRNAVETQVVNALLNVGETLREPWPLVIEDHVYRRHILTLEPGEMVLMEGARLLHGRPFALQGEWACTVTAHFRPEEYVPPPVVSEF